MRHYRILAISLFVVLLAGCSAGGAQNPPLATLAPTIAIQSATPAEAASAYPAVTVDQPTAYPAGQGFSVEPTGAYPAGPGPQGVPAVDNRATVTGKLIEQAPAEDYPNQTRMRVSVLTSTDVPGMQNFTRDLVNQQVDLLIDTALLPAELQPGDTFEATVSYRGDEKGGIYVIESLSKVAQ